MPDPKRKIPYNYTSADDDRIIKHLFGSGLHMVIKELEKRTDTGRSSRLLHRLMGDLFILQRNAFLFQELVEHPKQCKILFSAFDADLAFIKKNAKDKRVAQVYDACKKRFNDLFEKIKKTKTNQRHLMRAVAKIIGKENLYFDPFNITAHATDATDWRLSLPVAVLRPNHESQVPEIIKAVAKLGLHLIPRGAGTGLTGGATPLTDSCVMVNTEKLNRMDEIEYKTDADGKEYAVLGLEAGVITQDAIDFANSKGYIFATDPTSAWACTIGGNLSENAGGKTAVLYGTAIDNVLSFNIVTPDASVYTIRRNHHPLRKIHPGDRLEYDVFDGTGDRLHTISLASDQVRKKGLGKDVTNKALNGLPGIQKEGCDGIITSARFILYPKFKYKKTFCIEFFGSDMSQAGQVIAQITNTFEGRDPALMALEHFDREYARAIKYKAKTSVGSTIIAVLLIDMVSNDPEKIETGTEALKSILTGYDKTGFSEARDEKQARRFWQDRKRLGAIAAHTNAFKLNEDIVLPIGSLAEFAQWVDQVNIREKKINQALIIDNMVKALDTVEPVSDHQLFAKRVGQVKNVAFQIKKRLDISSKNAIEAGIHAKNFYEEAFKRLQGFARVIDLLKHTYETTRSRLIVIATHMHAGDGNVHVNIPVLSNDRWMMERANRTADRVMEKANALKGVVSGEHGIGVTKIKHLSAQRIDELNSYRHRIDPKGVMNPGKLSDPEIIDKVFTTSFNLLKVEAGILKHGSLSDLALKISNCVRCGKCKPVCPVFYPAGNMFFHPRNKNLSLFALIEALLYISQRNQTTAFDVLKNIEQIADHCTICHKCLDKCPVNIDSGLISIEERKILDGMAFKKKPVATRMTLAYLATKNRLANPVLRTALLGAGALIQRTASRCLSPVIDDANSTWPVSLLKTRVARPPFKTLRSFLPKTDPTQVILLEPDRPVKSTIFYFPGCGSERIFSSISKASLFLLVENGNRVVLPPSYLCCGYPFQVNAKIQTYETIVLENAILFSRIKVMFTDLDFDACVVSCGTCMESLYKIETDKILGCRITDISSLIVDQGLDVSFQGPYYYHQPCHDSLHQGAQKLFARVSARPGIIPIPYCCSEAGTMALSRPDISHAMLDRKQNAMKQAGKTDADVLLTNCPSCLQGLSRLKKRGVKPIHMAEELARLTGGEGWQKKLTDHLSRARVIPV
ncbi:MAG: DUF3683 domain-containing protein [Desulfobacterales bacterium]|nr:DUF3683 domain-containing protein [Desulfobacterales bacterium]